MYVCFLGSRRQFDASNDRKSEDVHVCICVFFFCCPHLEIQGSVFQCLRVKKEREGKNNSRCLSLSFPSLA